MAERGCVMVCVGRTIRRGAALSLLVLLMWRSEGRAIPLDKEGDFKLGARTYVNARVGTEDTHHGAAPNSNVKAIRQVQEEEQLINGTFPYSAAGHLRQNRAFIEAEPQVQAGPADERRGGAVQLAEDLPFRIKGLGGQVTFRGEGESLYDWGPRRVQLGEPVQSAVHAVGTHHDRAADLVLAPSNQLIAEAGLHRRRRHCATRCTSNGTDRERLFQAFVEGSVGDLFVRVGRQLLVVGRDRRLPAAGSHQPAGQQLRRLSHLARRAARAAGHDPRRLLPRRLRPDLRGVPARLRSDRQQGRLLSPPALGLAVDAAGPGGAGAQRHQARLLIRPARTFERRAGRRCC